MFVHRMWDSRGGECVHAVCSHRPTVGHGGYCCVCAGAKIANIEDVLRTVRQAHSVAMPDVPLVGWDVALTPGQ